VFLSPGRSHQGPLPPLSPGQRALQGALRADVELLAVELGERNLEQAPRALAQAAEWAAETLRGAGLTTSRQDYAVAGEPCCNVVGELPGTDLAHEVVVIGGHYDSVWDCPGANDNGTGVAATLALARALARSQPRRTLRFVAFTNEEPPYFQTEHMGSLVYARACRERGDRVVGMLSLETLGCFSDEEGTQAYPPPLSFFYPSRGDFVGFVGNTGSWRLVRRALGSFREHAAFPSEGAALPGFVPGVGFSDHWSFWQAGYAGVMVTDTAMFRYPHYHTPEDTPDKVDFARLARVVDGLRGVVADLAGGAAVDDEEPGYDQDAPIDEAARDAVDFVSDADDAYPPA
jgi:Peptidase family M28